MVLLICDDFIVESHRAGPYQQHSSRFIISSVAREMVVIATTWRIVKE